MIFLTGRRRTQLFEALFLVEYVVWIDSTQASIGVEQAG